MASSRAAALQPVILCGGSGTRLWPLSREEFPKQLLKLHGDATLLQDTATRLDGLPGVAPGLTLAPPLLVGNEEHRFLVAEQLEQIDCALQPGHLLLEPAGRNTAPALTLAARHALELARKRGDEDVLMLAMPADHVITDHDTFQTVVAAASAHANAGRIVTFGIVPERPETGFGYVRTGRPLPLDAPPGVAGAAGDVQALALDAFVEKPDADTARGYLEQGNYLWNGGIFLLRASLWLRAIGECRADIASACERAYQGGALDGAFFRVDSKAFDACPADSIDYAVMERVAGSAAGVAGFECAVVPLAAGWSDVGSWSALLELDADQHGNVVQGDVFAHDARDSLLLANSRLVAAVGTRDVVVIETPDAVLVTDRRRSQEVKRAVEWLNEGGRTEGRTHQRVYRPWGDYESLDMGERYQVKRLTVKPGAALSLQLHHHRAEHWVVVRGTARVTCGEEIHTLTENQSIYIPIATKHRLENPGRVALEVIEVQSGSYLGEDDIVRFDDIYNR